MAFELWPVLWEGFSLEIWLEHKSPEEENKPNVFKGQKISFAVACRRRGKLEQITSGIWGHNMDFEIYSEWGGKILECFEQGSDMTII